MAVVVVRAVRPDTGVVREVLEVGNAVRVAIEVVVPICDARVDDCDAYALTCDTQLLTRESCARRQAGALHRCEDGTVEVHALNFWIGRNSGKFGVIHFCNLTTSAKPSSCSGSFSE
jgi:hypothetical protein